MDQPTPDELRNRAVSAYDHLRDYCEAAKVLRTLENLGDITADEYLMLAYSDAQNKEDDSTIEGWLLKAREAGANEAEILASKSAIAWSRGEHDSALELAKRAASLDESIETLRTLFTLLQDDSPEDAEFVCRTMIRKWPHSAVGFDSLGSHLLEAGRAKEALPHLERAVELDPDNLNSLADLGDAYYELGKYTCAKQVFEILQKHPFREPHVTHYLIGMCILNGEGDNARARECFLRALELHPDFSEARSALEQLGDRRTD